MSYCIIGLEPDEFMPLFALDDAALAKRGARRVIADADRGFPCRVSLRDAEEGDELILVHHTSHDVATPYRSAYAIFVRKAAGEPGVYVDQTPPVFDGRPMAFRAFDAEGMLRDARLAMPGESDAAIRALFDNTQIAYIHAHNAAYGCFAARVERHGGQS